MERFWPWRSIRISILTNTKPPIPSAKKPRPITDMHEPGSVVKTLHVAAAALETGRLKPDTVFYCEKRPLLHAPAAPLPSATISTASSF